MIEQIKLQNLFDEFFSKNRCHSQLIQRSEYLLKLMIHEQMLEEKDYVQIWDAVKQQDENFDSFFKVLKTIASKLTVKELHFFIVKISDKPIANYTGSDIEILQELAVKSTGSIGSEEGGVNLASKNRS